MIFMKKMAAAQSLLQGLFPLFARLRQLLQALLKWIKRNLLFIILSAVCLWVGSMLIAGHFLQRLIYKEFHFDLKNILKLLL